MLDHSVLTVNQVPLTVLLTSSEGLGQWPDFITSVSMTYAPIYGRSRMLYTLHSDCIISLPVEWACFQSVAENTARELWHPLAGASDTLGLVWRCLAVLQKSREQQRSACESVVFALSLFWGYFIINTLPLCGHKHCLNYTQQFTEHLWVSSSSSSRAKWHIHIVHPMHLEGEAKEMSTGWIFKCGSLPYLPIKCKAPGSSLSNEME